MSRSGRECPRRSRAGRLTAAAWARGRRGVTLVELVLSTAIMSILMAGIASAILIASHALPTSDTAPVAAVEAAELANLIAEELRSALWIRERTATSVEFSVPDRDADGSAERIRYEWAGDALTRQYNGGSVVDVAASVQEFELDYEIEAATEEYSGVAVEGAEACLCSFNSWYDYREAGVTSSRWYAQYFEPTSFAADVVSWRVTRAYVVATQENNDNDLTYVQLRTADSDDAPTDVVLTQVELYESSLPASWTWYEIVFSDMPGVTPGDGLCLVFTHSGAGTSARLVYENDAAADYFRSSDQGETWSARDPQGLYYHVFGCASTPGTPQTATRSYVTSVRITLRTGSEASSRVVTTAQTLNSPELLSDLWEADFDDDPRLDHNGDGSADWYLLQSGTVAAEDLADGVWSVAGGSSLELGTNPTCSFAEPTTIDLSFRCTEVSGDGAYFCINADYTGGNFIPIVATLDLMSAKTQTATVSVGGSDVVSVSGLSSGFVTLRLLIDPDLDTVNIRVSDVDKGTYAYSAYAPTSEPKVATLYGWGSDAEWDYVRIRVGE